MEEFEITTVVASWGFAAGLIFGATAHKTNFCTMGAISDVVFMGDYGRFRAWILAIAVAILGTQGLHETGMIDIGSSIYLSPNFGWFGAILGGLVFGFGMTMTGGCGNKTLVRLGAGNLKSLVVFLVMGIVAYTTLRGLIGLARVEWEAATNIDLAARDLEGQGIAQLLAALLGMEADSLRWPVTLIVVAGLLVYCFKDREFRTSPTNLAAGLIIGALVPLGWYITGVIGNDDFDPVPLFSFTFVSPSADSIQYLMTYSGATINFGIGTVGGVIVGAFLMALATRSFHFEAFTDASDMARHLVGAVLMGFGGITALGCTIGQGITGMSTLAAGSVIALLSILVGGYFGMKYLEEGSFGGALKAAFSRT